jgi:hypothetical protein
MSDLAFLTDQFSDDLVNNGAWLHLLGGDNMPLFITDADGKTKLPVRAKVRSQNSEYYQSYLETVARRSYGKARKAKGNAAIQEETFVNETRRAEPESFSKLLVAFENLGKPGMVTVGEGDLLKFAMVGRNKPFVEQVLTFSSDPSNFTASGTAAGDEDVAPAGNVGGEAAAADSTQSA